MQIICTLALHHPLTAVSHEVTLRYVEQMQHLSLSCFAVGHTLSSMDKYKTEKKIMDNPQAMQYLNKQLHCQDFLFQTLLWERID